MALIAITLILIGFIALFTEVENFGWATITLIATLLLCNQMFHANLFSYVKDHLLETLVGILVYLAIGVVWSLCKWFTFLHKFKREFLAAKQEFITAHNLPAETEITRDFLTSLQAKYWEIESEQMDKGPFKHHPRFKDVSFPYSLLYRPTAYSNKNKIIAWMSLWPFSFIGTLINDPVRRLFLFLFNQLKSFYEKISDYVFKDTEL
jgi:hypothetical protein